MRGQAQGLAAHLGSCEDGPDAHTGWGSLLLGELLNTWEGAGLSHLNVSFELLVVDINGVLTAVIRPTPEKTIGHLDVQEVVQHLHLGLGTKLRPGS